MRVSWTRTVRIPGYRGHTALCRSEREAAELVLKLFLEGCTRYQIIVDGDYLADKGLLWIWEALGV